MNLPILQTVAWFVALVEFSVGLYVLLLNVWHNANRHVGALLLLTAVNTIAVGMLMTASTVEEATLPLIIQAMTTPAATIGLLLVAVVLLKPGWMSGRRLRLWLPLYGVGLLAAILTLADVWFRTQLWYTGPDPRTYAGGTLALGEYAAGRIALSLRAVTSYLVPAAALIFLLFVALLDKKVTSLTRRLAWLLFGALVLASVFQFGLRSVWGPGVAALLTSVAYAVAYSYAAFRQMVSERIYQRGRLQTRLVLLILAISLPLLASVSLFLTDQAGTLLRQDAVEQLHASRSALVTSTSVWLDLNIKALRQLVNQADIISMDPARQRPALQAMAAAFPHMYLVSTTDSNGMNVARNDGTALLDYSDRQWFLDARNGAPLTFQTLIGRTNNKPALVVSMPIKNQSGEIVGVGMFATELTSIAQSVEAVRIGRTGYAYIVDANNNLVAHPDPAFLTTGDNQLVDAGSFAPVRALRLGAKGVYAYRDQAGARWRADVVEMDYQWGVIVQQQEEELFSTLQLFRGISWAVLAAGVILLVGMVWLTMRQAFQPIGALTETVAAITAGDLTRTAPVETEDELGTLAQAFNSMTGQLREIIENLEQRVAERTAGLREAAAESVRHTGELERLYLDLQNTTRQAERRAAQLAASAQVARAAIQVRDLDRLLPQVTHLISQAFGYYHVGIFIVDEVGRYAILRAANSEGGQRMLARGHKLAVGKEGIVGYVTGTGQPRIALDVGADAVHFDNLDLPQTRSEMALPLRVRDPRQEPADPLKGTAGQVFGALDVQSTQEAAFSEEDVAVLSTLADQIAIAIENARLFAQSQAALQEAEQAQRDYIRQEWTQLLHVMQSTSHEYHVSGVPPVGDAPLPEIEQAIQQGRAVTVVGSEIPLRGDDSLPAKAALAMPIKLRDQIIGAIDLQEADAERQWTDEDVAMVTAVADQVALALENARLFEQTQMSLADTRALYEASAQINSATTLDEILSALRQHTELGQADLIVAINLFDTPWVGDQVPETIEVATRWTTLPVESLSNRYYLARFPAARLLRPDEPFVVADIEHDERLDDAVRQLYWGTLHAHSALLVPLVVAGLWIGFVDAIWSERREFAESGLRRIMLLSGQAATAVQTRRLFEQTRARVQQLAALNEISRAASGLLETDKLLAAIREQIQRIIKMDTFFVGVYDFQTRVISYPICYDDGRFFNMPPEQLAPDARSYGVILSGEPLLVEYSPEDQGRILASPSHMVGNTGRVSASLIYAPLRIGDRVIGVMSVQSYSPHVYTQEHVGLMMAIANQVAVALENSRLFEQARHRAVQLATASEAGRAATSILDMNELLQSVVELVCSRFGYDHAAVFLLDDTGQFAILRDATGAAPQDKAGPAIQLLKQGGYQFAVGGQSLVGWVTSKGRSRVVTDVNDDARYLKTDLWPQSRSELCIPLKRGERVIGALDVHSTNLAAFSQDDVAVLEMLTDQLAIAIQNARLYGQTREQSVVLEKRAADLAVLNEASRLMAQTFDPAEILNSAAQVMVRHFGIGHAAILLFNESKTILRVAAEYPDRGTVGAEALVAGSAALMEYIATRRAAAIDDVITDPRMESLRMSFLQLSIRSAVFLPLMVKNDLAGYIRLDAIGMLRRFTDEEVSLGQTLASQVAVALQNAWLYQAEQRRAARQAALYQVGRRMTATLDPSDLMNTVVESVQRDLGFERVLILLTDMANGEVYATAASTNFADLIPPNYRQRIGQGMIGLAALSGQTQLANDTQTNPNYYPVGAWNPGSELCVPLEVGGRVIGVLDVESDALGAFGEQDVRTVESLAGQLAVALENARLYEEQRQTAEKLREVDRLKTEFLANMSHELRTPLNSIIGFSRVILKGIDGPLTDLQKQDLEAIHGSGQQLLGLINDILDISKIEAGKMELAFQQVDLHDIVKGVMSSAVGLVKGKPIVLRQEVPDDLPTVWADVTRARQVLLNLVSNAAKFTDKGSITVFARYDDLYVTVGVRDTGIGIPADKLETIFEEFTQVDASTTRQHGGTGLGLAITRRFVQMHGGRVWAESELNHGSTFYFSLPRTQQVAIEADMDRSTLESYSLGGKRLLLAVDDDLGVITLYKRYLEKRGYQVVGVTDSRQVVEQARRLQPDVITLDILMPNKDGWSVIQELRQSVDTRHIPVVVCSIISDQGKGFSLGAADYLVKPITEDELVIALKRLDGRNQATVLIIDDKLEDARLIRRILEAPRGDGDSQPLYVVQEAHSGAEAIAAVRQNMPNLVLLDLLMPEVDGLAVLEAIKADPATRGIPVIVVTAKELTSQDHERLKGNIGALLAKGRFSEQDLLDDVAAALNAGVQAAPDARHPVARYSVASPGPF